MPSLLISVRNESSVELTAPAVPAVATAASPRAPATSAEPANVVRRAVANIGLLGDVVLSPGVSGLTSASDGGLGGFLKDSWRASAGELQPPFVQRVHVRPLRIGEQSIRVLGPHQVGPVVVGAARDATLDVVGCLGVVPCGR